MLAPNAKVDLDLASAHAEFGGAVDAVGGGDRLAGRRRVFTLHGGATASLNDLTNDSPLSCEANFAAGRWLSFALEGQTRTEVDGIGRCDTTPLSWSVIAQPSAFATLTQAPRMRFRVAHVALSDEWLGLLTATQDEPLSRLLGLHEDRPFASSGVLSAQMRLALESLFTAPSRGACDALVVESRVLDLLTHASALMIDTDLSLSLRDRRRLFEARDILDGALREPPTIVELSARVGLGATKLKRGFRMLFGLPVRAYVHARQLEDAMRKLEAGMSVSEVAYSLGYTPSAFTATFRRRFGLLPSTVARGYRHRPNGS